MVFWVLQACLGVTSKNNTTSLYKTLVFIFMQKNIFIPHLFLDILQRYWKLLILGAWSHPAKAIHQLEGNSDIYLHTKNFLDPSIFRHGLGFRWKVKNWKNFYFTLFLGKTKDKIYKKNAKYLILRPFLPKFGQKWIFHKNWTLTIFSI